MSQTFSGFVHADLHDLIDEELLDEVLPSSMPEIDGEDVTIEGLEVKNTGYPDRFYIGVEISGIQPVFERADE